MQKQLLYCGYLTPVLINSSLAFKIVLEWSALLALGAFWNNLPIVHICLCNAPSLKSAHSTEARRVHPSSSPQHTALL